MKNQITLSNAVRRNHTLATPSHRRARRESLASTCVVARRAVPVAVSRGRRPTTRAVSMPARAVAHASHWPIMTRHTIDRLESRLVAYPPLVQHVEIRRSRCYQIPNHSVVTHTVLHVVGCTCLYIPNNALCWRYAYAHMVSIYAYARAYAGCTPPTRAYHTGIDKRLLRGA